MDKFDPTIDAFNFKQDCYLYVGKNSLFIREAEPYTGVKWLDKIIHYFKYPNERLSNVSQFFQQKLQDFPSELTQKWFLLHNVKRLNSKIEKHNRSILTKIFRDRIEPINIDELAEKTLLTLKEELDQVAKEYLRNPYPTKADHDKVRRPVAVVSLMQNDFIENDALYEIFQEVFTSYEPLSLKLSQHKQPSHPEDWFSEKREKEA